LWQEAKKQNVSVFGLYGSYYHFARKSVSFLLELFSIFPFRHGLFHIQTYQSEKRYSHTLEKEALKHLEMLTWNFWDGRL